MCGQVLASGHRDSIFDHCCLESRHKPEVAIHETEPRLQRVNADEWYDAFEDLLLDLPNNQHACQVLAYHTMAQTSTTAHYANEHRVDESLCAQRRCFTVVSTESDEGLIFTMNSGPPLTISADKRLTM
uniref:Uncharacterized protein n=1 Tax=Romanomermis culicivorax TaxID=13658 RepID=A0A915L2F4_ROMCU